MSHGITIIYGKHKSFISLNMSKHRIEISPLYLGQRSLSSFLSLKNTLNIRRIQQTAQNKNSNSNKKKEFVQFIGKGNKELSQCLKYRAKTFCNLSNLLTDCMY